LERDIGCGIVKKDHDLRSRITGSTMPHLYGLIDFVGAHPQFAFITVLLLALSEAVPVIGTVVPGSTLILAISALATTADVKPWLLLVAAVAGAIAGDGLSFWLGHQYHREILRGWPLNRFPGVIARSAQFKQRHGIASVFLARFTAVVRAFVPLVAGILRMSSRHFYIANVLSALVWAPIHVFPGVLAGMAISVAGPNATKLGLLILGALAIASLLWHFLRDQSRERSGVSASDHTAMRDDAEIEHAVTAFARGSRVGLIVTGAGAAIHRTRIIDLAARHRLQPSTLTATTLRTAA
jgi:membrane protein DedA with SNARE-associated domain